MAHGKKERRNVGHNFEEGHLLCQSSMIEEWLGKKSDQKLKEKELENKTYLGIWRWYRKDKMRVVV
jgi:hypothetical protein